jgi:hypothetical protein
MMIEANGENRKAVAMAFATAIAVGVGTKLAEWAVERVRACAKDPKPPEAKAEP